jgi:hypothetical protein
MKDELRKEVSKLCAKNIGTEYTMDMTNEMHTLYCWALNNASIKQLKKWKKQFLKEK